MIKQKLQKWLEIEKPDIDKFNERVADATEDVEKKVRKLTSDLDFWKREFKRQHPTKKCTKCRQPIDMWPFNEAAYYIKGNRVTHQTCRPQEKG